MNRPIVTIQVLVGGIIAAFSSAKVDPAHVEHARRLAKVAALEAMEKIVGARKPKP